MQPEPLKQVVPVQAPLKEEKPVTKPPKPAKSFIHDDTKSTISRQTKISKKSSYTKILSREEEKQQALDKKARMDELKKKYS